VAHEGNRIRLATGAGGPGAYVDIHADPSLPRGRSGSGTVHHVAFRTTDDASQESDLGEVLGFGLQASPVIDRRYFHSIYYREPAGVLFEIATDGPGFTVDEPVEKLGEKLMLPEQHMARRAEIEAALPPLDYP
jgi:glyoxalase family protein